MFFTRIPPLAWLEFVSDVDFLSLLRVNRECAFTFYPFRYLCLTFTDALCKPYTIRRLRTQHLNYNNQYSHLRYLEIRVSHFIWYAIFNIDLPTSLTELHIHHVSFTLLNLSSLRSLRTLNMSFIGELTTNFLPNNLRSLTLRDFDKKIHVGALPESLEYLCLPSYTLSLNTFPSANLHTLELVQWPRDATHAPDFRRFQKLKRLTLRTSCIQYRLPSNLECFDTIWGEML
jgi:hypothetical protein